MIRHLREHAEIMEHIFPMVSKFVEATGRESDYDVVKSMIMDPNTVALAVFDGDQAVGFASYMITPEAYLFLAHIYVEPEYRKRLSVLLYAAGVNMIKELGLKGIAYIVSNKKVAWRFKQVFGDLGMRPVMRGYFYVGDFNANSEGLDNRPQQESD